MTTTIEDANAALRTAVQIRREQQSAGKPHEEWYVAPVAETTPERHIAADMLHDATRLGDEALHRLAGDGITHEQPTTSQEFYDLCDALKEMHRRKSSDYGSEHDPLANIRNGAEFVGIEPWRAAMVRLSDKVTRLATYCRTGSLTFESFEDTCFDLASYSLLTLLMHREGSNAASHD